MGDGGTILHAPTLLGGSSQQTSNVTVTLFSIRRVGSELFAVADGGVIIHSPDGVTWTAITSSTTDSLLALAGLNDSTWFAAGMSGIGINHHGSTWSHDAMGTTVDLRGLAVVGDSVVRSIWAVGDLGSILHSATGATGTWTAETSGTSRTLFDVFADTAGNALAVGSGRDDAAMDGLNVELDARAHGGRHPRRRPWFQHPQGVLGGGRLRRAASRYLRAA